MATYKDISIELKKDGLVRDLYRFQGARTKSKLSVVDDSNGDYIYFSNSLDHHKYFTIKRIRQLLNEIMMDEYGVSFSNSSLHNHGRYHIIKKLVLNSEKVEGLTSCRLVCSREFEGLIKDNYFYNHNKPKNSRGIERVDRRVYGGGYGVCDEWKQLMVYLTYFTATHNISRDEILELLRRMIITNRVCRKDNIDFIMNNEDNYLYGINPHIVSDFNKYNIINALESILDKNMVLPDSELSKRPTKTIKSVVSEYEKGREKTLELLGKRKY